MAGKANQNNSNQNNQNQNNNSNQNQNNQSNTQQNNNQNTQNNSGFSQDDDGKRYSEEELRALLEVGKTSAKEEFLKSIGLSDETELQGIIKKFNDDNEKNQTDLEKLTRENEKLQKQIFAEKELRELAETKLLALKFGANPETVDDLVVLAKSKIGDKELKGDVLAKTLDDLKGVYPFYFTDNSGQNSNNDNNNSQGTTNSLRGKLEGNRNNQNSNNDSNNQKNGGEKSLAERLVANRKGKNEKSSYFKRR